MNPSPQQAGKQRDVYVVCAKTADEARTWARQHGIPRSRVVYACHPGNNVIKMRGFITVVLPSFYERRDWHVVQAVVHRSQKKTAELTTRECF
ncbi:hypothetical protein [Streptomyces synnematoformans]|uniref:Uncharacterized protein n=1 Tax=Streptomyces synnematoformans TaxID=415721 RepID=A0ABN2XCA6_9ACTN